MSLFSLGKFILHSGEASDFKIDCDFLTEDDYAALALLASKTVKFRDVIGVPSSRGGIDNGARFAKAMLPYISPEGPLLIVDDVLTTGRSMNETRTALNAMGALVIEDTIGLVVFARGKPPDWIKALFWQIVGT